MTTQRDASRSGGRTATRGPIGTRDDARRESVEDLVWGSVALKPQRGAVESLDREAPRLRVAPPAPVRAPRAPFVVLVLLLVITGVVGILVLNTKINENAFRLHDLQQQQSSLDLRQQQLQQDLAQQESPVTLAAAARRLGLVPARTPAFIVLPDGRQLGVPQPGSKGR